MPPKPFSDKSAEGAPQGDVVPAPEQAWRGQETVIRRYRQEDAARVKAITAAAFEAVSIDAAVDRRWPGLAPAAWIERKWASMQPQLADHPEHCWVAEAVEGRTPPGSGGLEEGTPATGCVVGYVTCEVLPDRGLGRIPDLAVDARWRGRGLGRRLLLHALQYLRELGLPLAKIETLAHNEIGRSLYPSVGFELVATQYHYVMPLARLAPLARNVHHAIDPDGGTDEEA